MGFTGQLVATCESVWEAIRQRHPDVPAVVVTIASGTQGRRGRPLLGHFAAGRWEHSKLGDLPELFLSGEGLSRGAVDVLGTLLHEAAHGVAFVRRVQDTSRQGRYHNRRFREIGLELGLSLDEAPAIGWSVTSVPAPTEASYAAPLADLRAALVGHRRAEVGAGTRRSSNNGVAALCDCPRKIRVAPSVLVQAPIICGACRAPFQPA